MNKFILLFVLLCPCLLAAPQQSPDSDSIIVNIRPFPITSNWDGSGFLPVKIEIANHSHTRGKWRLAISGQGNLSHLGDRIATPIIFELNPGEAVNTVAYMPPLNGSSYTRLCYTRRCLLSISGTGLQHPVSQNISAQFQSRKSSCFFASPDLNKKWQEGLHKKIISSYSDYKDSCYSGDMKEWPADERIYSAFSFGVVTREYYDSLDQSYLDAISRWIAKGGILCIFDPNEKTPRTFVDMGMGSILTIGDITKADVEKTVDLLDREIRDIHERKLDLPNSWKDYITTPPTSILAVTLLAFAVLVGPLSLFVWAPAGNRQRLFILIPAFSLGFCAMIILAIFVTEGIGGTGARKVIVYLNPEKNYASIVQSQICRTAIIPSVSFPLDDKTEFYGSKYKMNGMQESWESITPNERSHGEASGRWFSSRSTINHQLKATVPTRARISIVGMKNGAPVIQSTVPCELTDFIYLDSDQNTIWKAASVPQGQPVTLTKSIEEEKDKKKIKDSVFPGYYLRSENFQAKGKTNSLAPLPTHPEIKWEKDQVIFMGPVANETTKQ